MEEKYYSVEKIADMLNMHVKTIQRYIREGKLRATKIGKAWRISGHDLSLFVEGNQVVVMNQAQDYADPYDRIKISSVVDIDVQNNDRADRIINSLTAALNAKPAEYGLSQMTAQYLEKEAKVRIMLWGSVAFMEAMMVFLQGYIEIEEGSVNE